MYKYLKGYRYESTTQLLCELEVHRLSLGGLIVRQRNDVRGGSECVASETQSRSSYFRKKSCEGLLGRCLSACYG